MKPRQPLSAAGRLSWLRLARTEKVGPVTFARLIARFGTADKALAALPGLARQAGGRAVRIPPQETAEAEIEASEAYGARIIAACEPDYPPLLAALAPPPPVLTLLGQAQLAARPTVAIVGARNASAAGRKIARDMATALGQAGWVTVSGLALGIDGEAHAASLGSGTIAVLGGGIDHIYPPQHERLYAGIAAKGLIVSESPLGHRARAPDFPRRNRLITGLSRGVVVIEAAERSGSLISARIAGEQGREVMAVPGSPLDPRAAGTNGLLKQGAVLVCTAQDVLETLSGLPPLSVSAPPASAYEAEEPGDPPAPAEIARVREALTPYPLPIDEIARAAGIGAGRCSAILAELELAGEAVTFAGGLAARSI